MGLKSLQSTKTMYSSPNTCRRGPPNTLLFFLFLFFAKAQVHESQGQACLFFLTPAHYKILLVCVWKALGLNTGLGV